LLSASLFALTLKEGAMNRAPAPANFAFFFFRQRFERLERFEQLERLLSYFNP
jgi:hypothetical protein